MGKIPAAAMFDGPSAAAIVPAAGLGRGTSRPSGIINLTQVMSVKSGQRELAL